MTKIITEALSWFESKQRNDDTIIVLKSGAPEALIDSVYTAHGDRLPDDWIYNTYYHVLEAFSGYTIENADDLEKNRQEIVDGLVDVYTANLTAWLASNNNNVSYITEAQEEYGDGAQTDGFKILQMAQYKAIDEIAGEVINYLTSQEE